MKLTKITEENIGLIRFRIEQFVKRMVSIKMQSFYRTAKVYQNLGITNIISGNYDLSWVSESGIWHYNPQKIELDYTLSDNIPYIRIVLNSECGMLIKLGDKIKITPTNIFLKENGSIIRHMEDNPTKTPFTIIAKGDFELAAAKEWRDKMDAEMYTDLEDF